jgi:cob(I)alamin adenosyltransferase
LKIYTKKGDDGSTGLFFGGRVRKDDAAPEAYGSVDEAVAALGVARAAADEAVGAKLLQVQRELFVLSAELATLPENRQKLEPGVSLVEPGMVERLEHEIDEVVAAVGTPAEFMVPGDDIASASLDLARAIVRRAERRTVAFVEATGIEGSLATTYLNRLSDYLYILTRAVESEWVPSRIEEE